MWRRELVNKVERGESQGRKRGMPNIFLLALEKEKKKKKKLAQWLLLFSDFEGF
jgi:hypothetical protein